MTLTAIPPLKVQSLMGDGALVVDIRSPQEFAASNIPGAVNKPLGAIDALPDDRPVIFMCRTGLRTQANAEELHALCSTQGYRLEGGIEEWRKASLPLLGDGGKLPVDRQAMIARGSLAILSSLFAVIASPWYFLITVAVGSEAIYAGWKGRSPLARLLKLLPGNSDKA